ncbi:helix-turn-helix transcriptional regulator [Anaerolinea sp.]|uniref:helix-turn-helix transcriptional regulator n=1 Tax=Anaerolinea sp. TaxID=1872519 RepID=UPI002ACEFC51|nr:winged helix-turn-helix transcriptional regulator [Anaerolinea sp.]
MEQIKSTRDRILHTLLTHPRSTIKELADAAGINGISVRHHLNALMAEGLIVIEEERHGVGRPRQVYSLSEKGMERFPSRYLRLTNRLLEQLKEALPAPMVSRLFEQIAEDIAAEAAEKVKSLPFEQKMEAVKQLLAQEGFTVEWEQQGDQYVIREITCPYYQIGQSHPEVCAVDQQLISTMLATPAEKVSCVLSGDPHCSYIISKKSVVEKAK